MKTIEKPASKKEATKTARTAAARLRTLGGRPIPHIPEGPYQKKEIIHCAEIIRNAIQATAPIRWRY